MNAPPIGSLYRWKGPVAASLLVVAIGCIAKDTVPRIVTELRLKRAAELVPVAPGEALKAIGKSASAPAVLSKRQRERAIELAREAVALLREDRPLLRRVGPWSFEPQSASHQYRTAGQSMSLVFELPPALRALSPRIRVTNAGEELCEVKFGETGTAGWGQVPLSLGATVIADIDLVCAVGIFGSISTPIAHNLHLVQRSAGPVMKLRAGDQLIPLADGQRVTPLQVARGTPLRIELADDYALNDLQWFVDGVAHDGYDWSEEADNAVRSFDLPDDLTAQASNRRVIELKASNSTATTRAFVELLVRDPANSPIARAVLGSQELKDGSRIYAGEKALNLAVTMADGELPDDLAVIWEGKRQRVRVSGQIVSAVISTEIEGVFPLVLQVKGVPLIHAMIHFDWTPPRVTAVLDPGRFAQDLQVWRAVHEAPIGAILQVTISDSTGLDRNLVEFKADAGLEEIPEDPASRPEGADCVWVRRFRCAAAGESRLTVSGSDLAGNKSLSHEYLIKIADPMEGRTVIVNGQPFAMNGLVYCSDTRFEVRTEGGVDVDGLGFFVLDPEQQNAVIGEALLERSEQPKVRTGYVDLSFIATSARRLAGVLSRNGRELLKGTIVIDFVPPSFRVMALDVAGTGRDGIQRYFAQPGGLVSLTVSDDVGVDLKSISALSGARIEDTRSEGDEIAVIILLPAVFDEPVVLKALDEARNETRFSFEPVVRTEPDSRPAPPGVSASRPEPPKPTADSGPPPPERAPKLAELQATPKIVHPQLGAFQLIGMGPDAGVPPFYIGEHEIVVKDWRAFVAYLQARAPNPSAADPQGARWVALSTEAVRLLNRNTNVLKKGDDDPLACVSAELARGYVRWANDIAGDYGVWKLPTALQWRLASGRAIHPQAVYPSTGAFPNGSDITNEGSGGALYGRDPIRLAEGPRPVLQAGAFGLKGMPGSLYEWVIDPANRLRLIGGSLVSIKDACRLDAPLKSGLEVAEWERGLRLALLPRSR